MPIYVELCSFIECEMSTKLDWCRFDGKDFLSWLKGKSIMFVGDSLGLNQWQSLTCMLHKAVPQAVYKSQRAGGLSTFTFPVRFSPPLHYVVSLFYQNI